MPLYMDVHRNVEPGYEEVVHAHQLDIDVQAEHGVEYKQYWIDKDEGVVFCLFEAPSKEAGEAVHRDSHGLLAEEIFEVQEGA